MSLDPNVGNRNWTRFVKVTNGVPTDITDEPLYFRTDTGERPTDEWLASQGYLGYISSPPPAYNYYEQRLIETPIQLLAINKNNTVTQTWTVEPLTTEEKLEKQVELRQNINVERERRLKIGANVSISGLANTVYVTGDEENIRNMTNLGQLSMLYIQRNANTTIPFRDAQNTLHTLTPLQMSNLWEKTVSYVSSVYQSSWAMKDMSPLPQDFLDDKYWPNRNI